MKLYHGPFKSKHYNKVLEGPVSVDRTKTTVLPNGSITTVTDLRGVIPAGYESFSSLYTPSYHSLVRNGWIIQCPYRKVTRLYTFSTCSVYDVVRTGSPALTTTLTYANMCGYAQHPWVFRSPPSISEMRDAAMQEAVTRVFAKAASPNADLLIDIAQLRELCSMFVKLANRFIVLATTPGAILNLDGIRALIRGDRTFDPKRKVKAYPVEYSRALEELAGLWCEMRFGWRPLMSTLTGVVQSFSDPNLGKERRITYRASERVKFDNTSTETSYTSYGGTTSAPQYYKTETSYDATFRAGILLAETKTLLKSLGLSAEFAPIAVWDLVPYSFIVDRFINVGNWIRSLRPIGSTDFGGAWCVERYVLTHVFRSVYPSVASTSGSGSSYINWTRYGSENNVTVTERGTQRTIYSRPPSLPTVRWDWSSINNLFNAVDGVMLAIQRLVPIIRGLRTQ